MRLRILWKGAPLLLILPNAQIRHRLHHSQARLGAPGGQYYGLGNSNADVNGVYGFLNSGKYIQKYGARFIDHRTNESILFNFGQNNIPSQSMAFEVPRAEFDQDLLAHAKNLGTTVYQPEIVLDIEEKEKVVLKHTAPKKQEAVEPVGGGRDLDRKSTRLNSSH